MVDLFEGVEEKAFGVFQVTDLETAAGAQREIAYSQGEINVIDLITSKQIEPLLEQIEQIKAQAEEAKKPFIERKAHYSLMLEKFMREHVRQQIESGKKTIKKTISFLGGNVSLKSQQPQFKKDEEVLLEYAKANGFVKVKEEIDWDSLKKKCMVGEGGLIDKNGEFVPGVEVIQREDKFVIKINE
ncbi:host-nuclease inhibitor Gam family protein [Priestia aryabhattai]|uniref:host-nuclease inhibitor Gam family protein n=1 Tax=Priestia aryabhattai TaxID=412384 RepID=UPI0039A33F2D